MEKLISDLPKVSIIIVNYNGHHLLELFMPSFVSTQYPDFEIIVVDNASNDGSVKYLKDNFSQIKIVQLMENKGFAEGSNLGAREASGKVLCFLNNDMEVTKDWLIKAILKLRSDKLAAAVQCKIMKYDNKKQIEVVGLSVDKYLLVRMIGNNETDIGQYNDLSDIGACSGGAMVIWRDIFFELGGFDPLFFMYYDDVDLSWRIRAAGYKILGASSSIVYHVGSASADITSPLMGFHVVKNLILCWLKNSKLRTIAVYWPVMLFLILGWASFSLLNGQTLLALARVKGMLWPLMHIDYILEERKKIKRKVSSDQVLFVNGIANGSTNISFVIKRYRFRTKNKKSSS